MLKKQHNRVSDCPTDIYTPSRLSIAVRGMFAILENEEMREIDAAIEAHRIRKLGEYKKTLMQWIKRSNESSDAEILAELAVTDNTPLCVDENLVQGTPEWLATRASLMGPRKPDGMTPIKVTSEELVNVLEGREIMCTSTEAAGILLRSFNAQGRPIVQSVQYIQQRCYAHPYPVDVSPAMQRGTALEPTMREVIKKHYKYHPLREVGFAKRAIMQGCPVMIGASSDGVLLKEWAGLDSETGPWPQHHGGPYAAALEFKSKKVAQRQPNSEIYDTHLIQMHMAMWTLGVTETLYMRYRVGSDTVADLDGAGMDVVRISFIPRVWRTIVVRVLSALLDIIHIRLSPNRECIDIPNRETLQGTFPLYAAHSLDTTQIGDDLRGRSPLLPAPGVALPSFAHPIPAQRSKFASAVYLRDYALVTPRERATFIAHVDDIPRAQLKALRAAAVMAAREREMAGRRMMREVYRPRDDGAGAGAGGAGAGDESDDTDDSDATTDEPDVPAVCVEGRWERMMRDRAKQEEITAAYRRLMDERAEALERDGGGAGAGTGTGSVYDPIETTTDSDSPPPRKHARLENLAMLVV